MNFLRRYPPPRRRKIHPPVRSRTMRAVADRPKHRPELKRRTREPNPPPHHPDRTGRSEAERTSPSASTGNAAALLNQRSRDRTSNRDLARIRWRNGQRSINPMYSIIREESNISFSLSLSLAARQRCDRFVSRKFRGVSSAL